MKPAEFEAILSKVLDQAAPPPPPDIPAPDPVVPPPAPSRSTHVGISGWVIAAVLLALALAAIAFFVPFPFGA